MEILHKFKQNGYFTADLYHLLTKKKNTEISERIIPSEYQKEMRMSTKERLQRLVSIEIDNIVDGGIKPKTVVLSFTPRLLVFQNFKPNERIVAKFSVKNISKASVFLNLVYKESSYFFITPIGGQLLSRLAPGIGVHFSITFIPTQYEDYTHRVSFYTDTDHYVLPLLAMGPRPSFDFPDEVNIPRAPIKIESYSYVIVTNIGLVPAGFTLETMCPFSVYPKSAYLKPGENIKIKFSLKTMHLGQTEGEVNVHFETGEYLTIKVIGTTNLISVSLERDVIRFLDTYNTMVRQQVVKVINKSDEPLTYMCMKNESVSKDFNDKVKLATLCYKMKENEMKKYRKLAEYDVVKSDEHKRVYTRIFFNEIQALVADESLLFKNMHFSITPISGNIWPNKATELTITFSPKEIGEFHGITYLDFDGVIDRIPLKMMGTSLPPTIHLNIETLNMNCVYINKMYNYEVVVTNKGHINGIIDYKEVPTLFGSRINCTPSWHCLRPGDKNTFVISFSNSNQGPFFEEINFKIRETDVVLKLYLKGEIIYPSVIFSIPCLDFGMISVGVPKTLELDVINESEVEVSASLKISSDGPEISSITLTDYAVVDEIKPDTPQWPREFDIVPRKISIGSESKLSLKVTLTANLIRANQTSLEMELEKSDSPPIVLPVIYNAMVPVITPSPDINMRACFVDYPYKQDIVITSNECWGYFTIYDPEEKSTLEVDIGVKEGLIRPNTSICLPLTIKTSVLGVQEHTVRLRLFGLTKPIDVCHITGCGVRPIVTCTPMALHWGQVKLLNKSQKILTLCNDSPVIVNFKNFLLNRDGKWQISPNEGQISPESEIDLLLNLFLTDADSYTNKVVLQLEKVKDIVVPLSATGVGTSIIVGELRDKVILGRHFTKIPLNCKVIMENCGTRLHALEWSEHFKAPKTKPNPTAFFNLNPRIFKMAAGEKVELTITGISSKTTTITEMWYLVGSVEGVNKKELLLECPIKAEFIDPKIEVSSSVIDLQYDYGPYSEYYKLTDIVSIKNVSRLPLDIDITIKPPFAIVHKRDTYKIPPEDENLCCCICYDEQDLNVQNMLSKLGHKQSRLFIDYLTHKPVEPLRKGSLNFFQDINKIKTVFNLTHTVEERLEDKELMRLQIVFDITKHTTLKSKIYHDLMRVKFKGHKNKDVIKLIGKINFPNILLLTPRIDFQCVLNATIQSKAMKLQNITPLMVCYRFQWKKCTITSIPEKFKALKIEEPLSKNVQSTIQESESIITGELMSQTHISDIEVIAKEVFENKPPIHPNAESIYSFGEESEEQSDVMNKRIMKSIEPMISKEYDPKFFWTYKFNKLKREEHTITINEIFQLAPHRGLLKPNEIQYVHVIFRPIYNISVRGILECEVLGGPSETIVVTGQSSDLLYSLSTKKLNFKIRSFHEEAIETLFITNAALLNFTCKSYLNEPKFENELEGTILKLLPKEKILEPEEVAQMSVVMRPGVVGYFHRQFLLEIGHLSHIPIEVFGWGVIPQIYLSLPRPDIISLDTKIGYLAIPALSMEYLEAVYEIFNKPTSDHVNTPLMERCFEDPELQQGWHICSIWDGLPSTMDIEMAIERFMVINHIKLRPEILTLYSTSSKTGAIPGFLTTPYVIDYGVVITGSTVQCSAEIVNYGPIPIKLHFSKGTRIPDWISIKFHSKLNPGETIKLEVTFSPTPEDFPEPEQEMKSSFNFEVTYGIIVPVQVKALCAVPYLVSNVSSIDFGSVRCGDKIISSIPLMNVGKPVCIWYVNLKIKVFGPNPMVILDNSGKYEPGEGGWLSVAFKPTMEMAYEGLLIFRFHMNPNRMTIPIRGQGVLPHVHIIGPNVKFSPTLPWAETTDIFFGLTNPCPFPIELIFAHSDEIWKEEEEILQLLYKYYNKPDEMLVPVIKPGNRLPDDIINFYIKFTERIKKCKEEQALSLKNASARGATSGKKGAAAKSPKTPSVKATTAREVTQKKHRTEAEIIAEEIQSMKESNIDPLKECLYVYDDATTESSTDKYTKGIIFFVHGSPCEEMQCQEIAYTIGKKLKIPTINIDGSIIDALCVCTCSAKIILIAAIDEMYTSLSQRRTTESGDDQELCEEEIFNETEDEFDVMSRKVQFLITNKNIATPRSKGGDKKKQPSSIVSNTALAVMGSTTLFHMDLMQELLSDYLNQPKFQQGFVLDTLTSNILVDPTITLTTVLRCKNTIRNIHLILCQSDFNKWVQKFEEAQRENELLEENTSKEYTESEIEAIVQSVEEMDDEEYENLLPELKSIYIASGLENRRRKYHEKHGYSISDTLKKDKFGKNLTDRSKSILSGISQSVKKVNKKDDGKAKVTTEYTTISARYNDYFKNIYDNIINIANNWIVDEGDVGYPLIGFNGQVIGSSQKKGKKKSDTQMAISDVSFSERGFPLSLIMCPCIQYKEAIVDMLLNSPVVVQALKQETTFDILKFPVKRKEFTVLLQKTMPYLHNEDPLTWHFLDEPVIKKCECNQITDLNMIDDSTQENILHILSKWHCTCGKKVTSSQTSTSEVPSTSIEKVTVEDEENDYPLPLAKVKPLYGFRGRIKLMPGDLVRCKYSFSPINEGNFVLKRFVEVSGWPDSRVDINVSGICDLPRIDNRPKKMFNNFVRRTLEDVVYKHTFLDDVKIFEFGPIFIGTNRIYEEFYTIELKNCSLITADIEVNFLEDIPIFQMDKSFLLLEPGCREKLTISAAPTDVGVHSNVLLFCIKDNPEIVTVNIACSGVVPIVEVLPQTKMIEYGKLLLYRREDDRFIVKNDSILPIKWVIRNAQEFVEDFIIAKTSGIVARHDNQVVPVTYIACRVGVISHKVLLIDIYDSEGRGEPMVVDTLYLSAECYDVMVECAHENPAENFLNYGNVKVNSTVYRDMFLLNRGKYNIYYKLKKVKNFPQPSLLRSFIATPECGVIPNTLKLVSIEFECTPTVSMNLVNVPAYICTLLDGSKNQVIVAEFPICVTIASFYNTFTLFPLGELNFHVIAVGSGVLREVILNNTSKCPFTYEIILPPQYQKDPDAEPSLKLKDNKIKNPPLRCGNFLIMNEDNLLAPGTSRTIKIQFLATASRKFEETINFIISDTCPAEACGVPLKLVGTGAMPTLDFWNIETTFREHLIVKNLSEYKVPESSPHCVFVEDSVSLYFFCVTINTKFTAAIDLYNNGCVACALTMKLHYQSNSNSDIFSLDKYETHIEPLLHKNLRIIFTPNNLQEYRAVLEVKIKLLDNQEQSYKICLIGEGVIPRLQMISPTIKQYKMALLNLPITCLGSISEKSILFKNISTVKSLVVADIKQPHYEKRPVFSLSAHTNSELMVGNRNNVELNVSMQLLLKPDEVANLFVHYNPLKKGKSNCDVQLTIIDNPYEHYTVLCEAEAFMEDVILAGLEMLPMDLDVDTIKMSLEGTSASTVDSRKKSKSAPTQKLKSSKIEIRKSKKTSQASMKPSNDSISSELAVLKYLMNFGGCELGKMQRRTVTMLNNSEKVYKFDWENVECVIIKPSVGFISPGEEKDLEMTFFSALPVAINKELIVCSLQAIRNDFLTVEIADATWDNRQTMTLFNRNQLTSINERQEKILNEQVIPIQEHTTGKITFLIFYSVTTEYTRYTCTLPEEIVMKDTFIYQTRTFNFKIKNTGTVSLKVDWSFQIDEEFPARIDKYDMRHEPLSAAESMPNTTIEEIKPDSNPVNNVPSKMTLFSGSIDKESVDTWFEIDLPFKIEPSKDCLKPNETRFFTVTFAPLDAFEFRVKLKGSVDNLDPYDDTNATCKIVAKSLIPYVHLDIEESDYLTSGRRKIGGVALPPHMSVLEFNVLGSGCYKKKFNVINPTLESYEFIFEMVVSDKPELIPVHCDMLKGFIESGTSASVTFTFAPTAPGVYESQWRFIIPAHNLVMNLLVVGTVREPEVMFVPTILIIRNSLVGFTTKHSVILRNNESESLKFEFKGNSLCNESGKTPVIIEPEKGVLKPRSNTQIKISYNPIEDGPLSFKIFCSIQHLVKVMALCVNALSYSIKPKVTYFLIGNEHVLNSEAVTHIYLDETASTYERIIPFIIKNDGSATFQFDWNYTCSSVKKYLNVKVEPKSGHVAPANEIKCTLHFHLKKVPVQAFPVDLEILDGPTYNIFLNSEIKKPLYHFSCMEYDFGKCIVNAPDSTYKKNLAFVNDDNVPIIADLNFENLPELFIDYPPERTIDPKRRLKIPIYFRPKAVKEYEFKLQFWVNSLCEEIIIIRGEGVPLLFDLYEGCQKSFDMGPVRVGEKKIREIEVMNHSKVPIEASFIFRDMYPVLEDATNSEGTSICLSPSVVNLQAQDVGPSRVKMLQIYKDDNVRAQINKDIENALASLKVIPDKCTIKPFRKVPLKIQFKPVGMISTLNSQLNMKVFHFERPLVRISGSATGMHLFLSQNSLQFGRVRKRGCKILKVMLQNAGDFGARFWWQPLISNEFIISPMYGHIAARTNVTFTITFKPLNNNPFIKVWASCNIENYMPLELAMYATCVDTGDIQNKTIYFECPVREVLTLYVVITNPSDDMWFVLAEVSGGPFDTLKEFNVEPNSVSNIPVNFRPKTIGKHESQVLYSPLGESALFVTLIGAALHPNPNGTIPVSVMAKHPHTEELMVYNITEFPESYLVSTEVVKVIPEKFDGYYEIKHTDNVKTWGEAAATCRWTFVCYGECEMHLKVMFINEDTREYQFYNIIVTITPSEIVDILKLESRARESAQRELVVSNPLSNDAEYYVKCNKVVCVDVLKINRNSEEKLLLTYSPLVVGDYEDFLEISNELIGTYVYKLMLTCLPAKEKHMEFSTPFGTRIPIRLRVQNRTDVKVDFLCTMSHTSIQVEKEYSLGPLEKGKFLVWFEPTQFDVQHCRVSFDSVIAGEFVFNIKGIGLPPKPQGPYDIKAGGFTVIKFRNVFDDLKSFKIHVDRDEFYVKTFLEHIRPKKELLLNVYLQESSTYDWSQPPSGCLVIETCEPTEPKIQWMYFLRGVR